MHLGRTGWELPRWLKWLSIVLKTGFCTDDVMPSLVYEQLISHFFKLVSRPVSCVVTAVVLQHETILPTKHASLCSHSDLAAPACHVCSECHFTLVKHVFRQEADISLIVVELTSNPHGRDWNRTSECSGVSGRYWERVSGRKPAVLDGFHRPFRKNSCLVTRNKPHGIILSIYPPTINYRSINNNNNNNNNNAVALVRERIIPTEGPPLVGEVSANFCGKRGIA
jgi:hypothetical protein